MVKVDEKLEPILAQVLSRNAGEPEFHQAVREVLESLGRVIAKHPDWADDALIERWSALPEWPQMLLRALIFRLAVHALHPRSTAAAFPGLARTASLVRLAL